MIRLIDTIVLATTKLRSHRIRTGITVGVSGVLFGLIVAAVLIIQGIFSSVERFSGEGLNSRYVISLGKGMDMPFDLYSHLEDPAVVKRVEKAHDQYIAKKQAAAKKYGIEYNPKVEDPSPISINPTTKSKVINESAMDSPAVTEVSNAISRENYKPFDVEAYLRSYKTAKILGTNRPLVADDGLLAYMKSGKETGLTDDQKRNVEMGFRSDDMEGNLAILPQTLAQPFISAPFDPSKGELPVILPYGSAEKLLGLKPLKNATNQQKRDRIQEVRRRVGEITLSFCYRNAASGALLSQAEQVTKEIEKNKQNSAFQKPSVTYKLPANTSCGAVKVASDTRAPEEKKLAKNMQLFQSEMSGIDDTPRQQKITLRAVGISADAPTGAEQASVSAIVQSLFSSSLGWGVWNIPEGLLEQVPASAKPAAIFTKKPDEDKFKNGFFIDNSYLVEFSDKEEARALLNKTGFFSGSGGSQSVYAVPYGSSSLVLDELKAWANTGLFWVLIVVGAVASLILSGLVGRTIADGRRETAVFRAIGATRGMIARIYFTYTLLFSLRVILFAAVLGGVAAGALHLWLYQDATIGAQLAFSAVDQSKQFVLFDVRSVYLPIIFGVIVAIGLISTILPLLRNIGRNPIRDMRDE
ncbi:MAG TPA: ABC transporter permease [Candidatus Saccharimonadales bacterium]